MAASIMLAGLTGHVGLPPMYAEMRSPSAFNRTLYVSFALMLGMYAFVGLCGYLLYGQAAHMLITEDMSLATGADPLSVLLTNAVLLAITFKIFCSVPMCVVILVDIVQNVHFERTGSDLSESASDKTRFAFWLGSTAMSIATYPYLQYVTALIGVNSLLISVLLPILFYVLIHRDTMGPAAGFGYGVLLLASLVVTGIIAYVDVQEFLEAISQIS
jgi:vesicular inhibitory amino acid transporter